jgi:phosphoglucomutase
MRSAARTGVKVINTLTGFKWIAAKLLGYDEHLRLSRRWGRASNTMRRRSRSACAAASPARDVFCHSASEESYGYLPNDIRARQGRKRRLPHVRRALRLGEDSSGLTVPEHLDRDLCSGCGFYLEGT